MADEMKGPQAEANGPSQHSDATPDPILSGVSKPSADLAARFHALFAGLDRAYGTYKITDNVREDGKVKGDADFVRDAVTDALWTRHLTGKQGLGIVPIRDDNTVTFGAIDVDVYDLDPASVAALVARKQLPLVPCRSKSGGVHLYLFTQSPVPAAKMQDKLRELAAALGYGNSEIFPKQTKILNQRDVGSFINMPYFDVEDTVRYAVRPNGDAYSVEEFLALAEGIKVSADWIARPLTLATGTLPDGPPCLQHLIEQGVPQGMRNRTLFNLAVYCRKAGDGWQDRVAAMNQAHMKPPLPHNEVSDAIKSVGKKQYGYTCSDAPFSLYCNKAQCRARKLGVGGDGNRLPMLGSLVKLLTDPPVWFLDVEQGQRLELTTQELLNPIDFQRRCAESLKGVLVPSVKRSVWEAHLRPIMESVTEVPAPEEVSPVGHLKELLTEFLTKRAHGWSLEEVTLGKPYRGDGKISFRLSDLMDFLARKQIKYYSRQKVALMLRTLGAEHAFRKIEGRGVNLWSVSEAAFPKQTDPLEVPASVKEDGGLF